MHRKDLKGFKWEEIKKDNMAGKGLNNSVHLYVRHDM